MKNKKIIIINDNKFLLDIEIYYRLNILFSRGMINESIKKQKFSFNDGAVFVLEYKKDICNIKCYYDYKAIKKRRL